MIGLWRRIERDDWTRLGTQRLGRQIFTQSRGQNNALGHTTVLGTRTWDSKGRFDIIVGPLNLAQFQSFLPGGASHKKLTALIRFYAGDLLDCGIRLSIAPAEVPFSLNSPAQAPILTSVKFLANKSPSRFFSPQVSRSISMESSHLSAKVLTPRTAAMRISLRSNPGSR
jgi:predicted component of type VI protein secretion system